MGNTPQNGTNLRHTYSSGDQYVGDFKDGQRHGHGVYTSVQGHRYEGAWMNDVRHGIGTQIFVTNPKKGKSGSAGGTPTKGSPTKNEGQFGEDQGSTEVKDRKLEWAGTYKGEWANNLKHGKGVFNYRNKDKYEGDWMKGMKHGNGVYTYANGDRYEGEFNENYMHGRGILYVQVDGTRLAGNWWKDELHGEAVVTTSDGKTFKENYEWGELKSPTSPGAPSGNRRPAKKPATGPSMPKTTETQKDAPLETSRSSTSTASTASSEGGRAEAQVTGTS